MNSLTFRSLKGGRGCGKLAARSTGLLLEAEVEERCNFFQKLEQTRKRRQEERTCCLSNDDGTLFGAFGGQVVDDHSLRSSLDQKMEDSLSHDFRQYLSSLRQPRNLWSQR